MVNLFVCHDQVTEIESRSALIQLSPPEYEPPELDIELQDCRYELLLSDKGREAKYKTVFWSVYVRSWLLSSSFAASLAGPAHIIISNMLTNRTVLGGSSCSHS